VSGPAEWDAVEAAEAVRGGRITSRALVQACLDRIERHGTTLNAFLRVDAEAALAAADAADAAIARGEPSGPLHGVPLAYKDMFYRAGRISSCGSKVAAARPAPSTATVLERLDRAGAIELGVLNMAEFAYGPTGHNYHYGHCRNPWHPDYITGGSSSGSGSAVAARLAFAALGSDTGGSIRAPAAFCGLTGIKPTYGRVSRHGAMPLSFSLDHIGPLARSARDCARLLALLAGHDPRDPTTSRSQPDDYEGRLAAGPGPVRIGIAGGFYTEDLHPDVAGALHDALEVFGRQGVPSEPCDLPDILAINALAQTVMFAEAAAFHGQWLRERPQDYSEQVRARLELGLGVTAVQYLDALRARGAVLDEFLATAFARADVLIAPVLCARVPTIADTDLGGGPNMLAVIGGITRNLRSFNYLGLPVLTLPVGFDGNGLPIGVQLVGRPWDEARLLALGHRYQQATDWHRRMPAAVA
jgi:aspartyl-tRNA(Asn)/glutamyl-tRNA(Gln) amidotransferase subunit A